MIMMAKKVGSMHPQSERHCIGVWIGNDTEKGKSMNLWEELVKGKYTASITAEPFLFKHGVI